jgi:hypothetical protein
MTETLFLPPHCRGCGRTPNETGDYDLEEIGIDDIDANHAMVKYRLDGTYNPDTNRFWCDRCYIQASQPLGLAP